MRRLLSFLALVVLLSVFAEASFAQDRTSRVAFEALTPAVQARVVTGDPLLRFRTEAVPGGRMDVDDGVLRAAYRIGRRVPQAATAEATARTYLNAEAARFGWPDADDLDLMFRTDSVDEAFDYITSDLMEHALQDPGERL